MKFVFIVIALSTGHFAFAETTTLGDSIQSCYDANIQAPNCKPGEQCIKSNLITKPFSECLEKLGIKAPDCSFGLKRGKCDLGATKALFPQSEQLRLKMIIAESKVHTQLIPDVNAQVVGRFSRYIIQTALPVNTAARSSDGAWKLGLIGFPVGLDSIAAADETALKLINPADEPPWNHPEGGGRCDQSQVGTVTFDEEFVSKVKKQIGFTDTKDLMPSRHFAARNTSHPFPVAKFFSFTKNVKLCGVVVPSRTELSVIFTADVCKAMVDGAVSIAGFRRNSFAHLKSSDAETPGYGVTCAPKAQAASNISTISLESEGGKKPITLPKLDWQQCDCSYGQVGEL